MAETDAGKFYLKREPCALGALIRNEVKLWQLKAEMAKISLKLSDLPPDLPVLNIDVLQISQVLGNLIDKGLKYSSEYGRIMVECRGEEERLITSVSDNGSGLCFLKHRLVSLIDWGMSLCV